MNSKKTMLCKTVQIPTATGKMGLGQNNQNNQKLQAVTYQKSKEPSKNNSTVLHMLNS